MCFQKQPPLFLRVPQIPQENTGVGVSFLKKLQVCNPISFLSFFYNQSFMSIMLNPIICINFYLNKS